MKTFHILRQKQPSLSDVAAGVVLPGSGCQTAIPATGVRHVFPRPPSFTHFKNKLTLIKTTCWGALIGQFKGDTTNLIVQSLKWRGPKLRMLLNGLFSPFPNTQRKVRAQQWKLPSLQWCLCAIGCVSTVGHPSPLTGNTFVKESLFVHTDIWREKPCTSDTSQPQTAHCVEQTEAHYGVSVQLVSPGELGEDKGGKGGDTEKGLYHQSFFLSWL